MSNYDYSGIDERVGRWWQASGSLLLILGLSLVIGMFFAIVLFITMLNLGVGLID